MSREFNIVNSTTIEEWQGDIKIRGVCFKTNDHDNCYQCSFCYKTISSSNPDALTSHANLHSSERVVSGDLVGCRACQFYCNSERELQQHYRWSKHGWFNCSMCVFSTPSKTKMNEHKKEIHLLERPQLVREEDRFAVV